MSIAGFVTIHGQCQLVKNYEGGVSPKIRKKEVDSISFSVVTSLIKLIS